MTEHVPTTAPTEYPVSAKTLRKFPVAFYAYIIGAAGLGASTVVGMYAPTIGSAGAACIFFLATMYGWFRTKPLLNVAKQAIIAGANSAWQTPPPQAADADEGRDK